MNLILNTDSYKYSHYLQYPPGTVYVSSYIEARGGVFDKVMFFGLQMFLKEYLSKPITYEDIVEAEDVVTAHGLPFNKNGWLHILQKHNGYLPLLIQALPEGTITKTRIPQVQVVNTDPEVPWLTTFIETSLLRAVWYPSTVATQSWHIKQLIKEYLDVTADNSDGLPFKLHDFGCRGVSSRESAGIGGCAHLVNFMGTDTVESLMYACKYYNEQMAGFSIPAAEHSTITCWGRDNEREAYANMIKQFGGSGKIFAVVSDSYDIWNAVENIWGNDLHAEVVGNGGTLVVRPDSGQPWEVVPKLLNILGERFGDFKNTRGYKVLPSYLRVIQGDGVNKDSIHEVLAEMKAVGWSADNIAFGMGGQLLQQVHRDTCMYAMKANAIKIRGAHGISDWIPVSKNPIDDNGKASLPGRQAVIKHAYYQAIPEQDLEIHGANNLLENVWQNGVLLRQQTFADVRGW